MKSIFIALLSITYMASVYSCSGDCVRCQKSGSSTLNYCENDFPSTNAYNDQINGLDSLGYTCIKK